MASRLLCNWSAALGLRSSSSRTTAESGTASVEKSRDLLLDAVFEDAEVIFAEISDKIALGIFYRHRHDDQFNGSANSGARVGGLFLWLVLLRSGAWGGGAAGGLICAACASNTARAMTKAESAG